MWLTLTFPNSFQPRSPLSPLLSNVVLDELDKELEKRGLSYCRFADDCNIFVRSPKAAERVMSSITVFIEKKLKLVVNQVKSKVAESSLVKFLGMTIMEGKRVISRESMRRALRKVKELTPRGTHEKLEATVERINSWYMGWPGYYRMTQYPNQLRQVEGHLRRRLRSRLIAQQKSRRNSYNKLLKREVRPKMAANTCFSNRGRWALSRTITISKAYSNYWFIEEMGLKIRSTEKHSDWFDVEKWIKLR